MPTATVTSKGQVTIPREVRRQMGVSAGDRIDFVRMEDGHFAVVPASHSIRSLKGILPRRSTSKPRENARGHHLGRDEKVIGIDTNVLVRYFAQDDEDQSRTASRVIEALTPEVSVEVRLWGCDRRTRYPAWMAGVRPTSRAS
jgi:antitoxin PrlF